MSDLQNHWNGFLSALGKSNAPSPSNSVPFETSSSKIGVSGFLDLKPANPKFQAQYDAMSGSWEGVAASEKQVLKSKSITEFMSWNHK